MDDSLATYIGKIELLSFFGGYPLVYCLVFFIANLQPVKINPWAGRLKRGLPLAYALVGTLFAILVVKETFVDNTGITSPAKTIFYLRIWGIMAVIFWLPALAAKSLATLVHSLVIFSLLVIDLVSNSGSVSGRDVINNDMRVYTFSILLNLISLALVLLMNLFRLKILRRDQKGNG